METMESMDGVIENSYEFSSATGNKKKSDTIKELL